VTQRSAAKPLQPARPQPGVRARILRTLMRGAARGLLGVFYRIAVHGREHMPEQGPALLLGNHVSYLDGCLLGALARQRWVRFLVFDTFFHHRWGGAFLRLFAAVPVSATRAKDAIKAATEVLRQGEMIALFPEGQITRHGCLNEVKKGFELMLRGAPEAVVVPVWLDQIWGSIFSFQGGQVLGKRPQALPYHASVWFGPPIPNKHATAAKVTEALRDLSAQALATRPETLGTLGQSLTEALRRRPSQRCLYWPTEARWLSRRDVWLRAQDQACTLRRISGHHVRISTDPEHAAEAALTAIAAVLAGKVPVFDPATPAHPSPAVPASIGSRFWQQLTAWLPRHWCSQRLPDASSAVAYRTDTGSLTEISHRALLTQIEQLHDTDLLYPGGMIECAVPLHTAAGQILGLWWPLLTQCALRFQPELSGSLLVTEPNDTERFVLIPGENCLTSDPLGLILSLSQPHPPKTTDTADEQLGWAPGALGRPLLGFSLRASASGTLVVAGPAVPHGTADTSLRAWPDAEGFFRPA
jgi:1-acyl-sn-glycerol-3-phosphate acyltransferase